MSQSLFTGSGVALVTPFNRDGSVNYRKLRELTDWQINHKTDAIIVCGTTGEASTLTHDEKLRTIQTVVEQTAGRVPVIAGTGTNDTASAVSLSQAAQKLGVDGLLLVTPYYNKATQNGLIRHYSLIAESVDIPCILYNVPSRTTVNILPETYRVLSQHPNIVAVKEASGNIAISIRIRQLCGDALDIYSGNDDIYLPMLSIGAKGIISVLANILPQSVHDMYQMFLDGHVEQCAAKQTDWMELIDALFCQVNPMPIKVAMNWMGFDVGSCRLPLCEMDEMPLRVLKATMQKYKLI